MKPTFQENGVEIYSGDCREVLRSLPDESVNCCVTSPPYWGLRDYSACDCSVKRYGSAGFLSWDGANRSGLSGPILPNDARCLKEPDADCPKCEGTGKVKGVSESQIGLEDSPVKYIATMREVFAEVRRVLRSDGVCWINMGDSYASGDRSTYRSGASENKGQDVQNDMPRPRTPSGLKPKDLVGVPWMLAFALREDGWYLRQDIIWSKPNPMPESVTDRCTKAHEYIFLLSKSERYYFNQEAILEACSLSTHARLSQDVQNQIGSDRVPGKTNGNMKAVGRQPKESWNGSDFTTQRKRELHPNIGRKMAEPGNGIKNNSSFDEAMAIMPEKRNRRSVWEVTTQPFPEAHFATFPEDLIKPCILAGCPEGGTVLDPFGGSGTTAKVARDLNCRAILVELNPDYIQIAARRLSQHVFNFAENRAGGVAPA